MKIAAGPKYNILILAPQGQDARLAAKVLQDQGLGAEIIPSIEAVCERLRSLAGALLVTEEAFTNNGIRMLYETLRGQESWSDLPIILVTSEKSKFERSRLIIEHFGILGNISLLERPFSVITLSTMAKVALRSRERQYEINELIQKLNLELQSKDDFLSVASHELKTPITALKLQVDIRRRIAKNPPGEQSPATQATTSFLDTIDRQVSRISVLVDDMLDISRIEHGKLTLSCQPCDLREIVAHIAQNFSPMLRAAEIEFGIEDCGEIVGNWDRFRIEQIVTNLLSNAIKYGESGPIRIRIFCDGNLGKISVIDQGPGISPEDQERIFQRFERVADKNSGVSGLGLGLFISRQIAELHGGTLSVENNSPRGAVFTLSLPIDT